MITATAEDYLRCTVDYIGNDFLRVQKSYPGSPDADFAQLRLGKDGRMHTEYIPGYGGLNFDRVKWHDFFHNKDSTQHEFKYPEWSTPDFEAWKKGP